MSKYTKPVQRGNSSKNNNPDELKTLPPIRNDGSGTASKSVSRGPTPTAAEGSGVNLPSIRPPSARVVDTTTRVQIKDRERQLSIGSEVGSNPVSDEILKAEDDLQAAQPEAAQPESGAEPEDPDIDTWNDNVHRSEDETLLLSSSSHIEIEDPERQYWLIHAAPHKNPPNVTKETLKRIQAASASKKLDISDVGLFSIPDKVKIHSTYQRLVFLTDRSQVFGMEDLKAIWAQMNKIEVIPAAIGSLRQLTQLRLFKNKLR